MLSLFIDFFCAGYALRIFHHHETVKWKTGFCPGWFLWPLDAARLLWPLWCAAVSNVFQRRGFLNSTLGFLLPSLSAPCWLWCSSADTLQSAGIIGRQNWRFKWDSDFSMFVPMMKSFNLCGGDFVRFMNAWNNYLCGPRWLWPRKFPDHAMMMISKPDCRVYYSYGMCWCWLLITTLPAGCCVLCTEKKTLQKKNYWH